MGAAAIFARYALTGAGPLAVAAGRLSIAAAVLLAAAFVRPLPRLDRNGYLRLGAAAIALAVHFGTWIASLNYTSVAVSSLLVATSPLWNAAYDALALRRRFPPIVPAALGAALAGLALVTSDRYAPAPYPGHQLLGAALAVGGALAFAVYLVIVRGIHRSAGTRTIVTGTYTGAAIVLIVAAVLARQPLPPPAAQAAWGGIAAMALVSQLLGHTAMNAALRWFGPTTVAVSTLVEPVAATLLALAIFGESLTPAAIAGGALLLCAVGVILWTAPDEELA